MVVTDSGGVLQEAHYAQTPYVFVLDIPKPPKKTRFDVTRLVKPDQRAILEKLAQPQRLCDADVEQAADKNLAASTDQAVDKVPDVDKAKYVKTANQDLHKFEENVLAVLQEFDCKRKKEIDKDLLVPG